ncbi:MAG: division/cell wall cluster transcriptional repressor MraZ [Acidimicrobiia bacterium]|nr:division/cell wall cluster transcriptional repressor MraZ [Acidimicrobiia bacterium]
MFLGEFQHSLDAKGRVILPAKFRDQLAGGAFVAKGDGCLFVYTPEEFMQVASEVRQQAKLSAQRRQAARSFFAGASEVTPDKQGRVAIPQHLRDYAGLERDIVVAGVFSRIEIWDSARWRERDREGDLSLAATEDLPDFGI